MPMEQSTSQRIRDSPGSGYLPMRVVEGVSCRQHMLARAWRQALAVLRGSSLGRRQIFPGFFLTSAFRLTNIERGGAYPNPDDLTAASAGGGWSTFFFAQCHVGPRGGHVENGGAQPPLTPFVK